MCEVSAVGKISDYQAGDPGFNSRPRRELNFVRPSFATPPVERHGIKPLAKSLEIISRALKITKALLEKSTVVIQCLELWSKVMHGQYRG